jgi:hypothetical protein
MGHALCICKRMAPVGAWHVNLWLSGALAGADAPPGLVQFAAEMVAASGDSLWDEGCRFHGWIGNVLQGPACRNDVWG